MPESLLVEPERAAALKAEAKEIPVHDLTPEETDWLELLLRGVIPLERAKTVTDGLPEVAKLALRDAEGVILAIAESDEGVWTFHGLELPTRYDSLRFRGGPGELKEADVQWGVFCREPLHRRGIERLNALLDESVDHHVVLFVPAATTESGDFPYLLRQREIVAAARYLPESQAQVVVVPFPQNAGDDLAAEILRGYGCASLEKEWSDWRESMKGEAREVEELIRANSPEAADASFVEVREEVKTNLSSSLQDGFTVFFTGLSGSGKSTVARHVQVKLLERGGRDVSLLDGDLVRKHLSSELGFSKEHRDLNIRRIGYVASEVTKHGGAAVCCPIAPYDVTRKAVRSMIEPYGGFILVHISTPVEVCEARDRKGLYAKARAGIIKEFTGISDPYESPEDADLVIDTSEVSAEDAADRVVGLLGERGYLP